MVESFFRERLDKRMFRIFRPYLYRLLGWVIIKTCPDQAAECPGFVLGCHSPMHYHQSSAIFHIFDEITFHFQCLLHQYYTVRIRISPEFVPEKIPVIRFGAGIVQDDGVKFFEVFEFKHADVLTSCNLKNPAFFTDGFQHGLGMGNDPMLKTRMQ